MTRQCLKLRKFMTDQVADRALFRSLKADLPQVKRNLISRLTNLVYELPHKMPNEN